MSPLRDPSRMEWKKPPERRMSPGRPNLIEPIIASLKERPGEWALVAETTSTSFGQQRLYLQRSGCEVAQRQNDGVLELYARWPVS